MFRVAQENLIQKLDDTLYPFSALLQYPVEREVGTQKKREEMELILLSGEPVAGP